MADSTASSTQVVPGEDRNLILDEFSERLSAFKALSKEDPSAANDILEQFGAKGKAETDIIRELAARRPLWLIDRFEEAHRVAMRSLEVLDRNGARAPKLPRLGLLQPVGAFLVGLVARFIVRNHQANVIGAIRNLYLRRESQCRGMSPERALLRRARLDADRVAPTLRKNPVGVPAFLLGGAFLSSILSSLGRGLSTAGATKGGVIVAAVILFLVIAAASWIVVRGAAVARHRIKLTLDQPLKGLWETVGAAGQPPKDQSRLFALVATLLPPLGAAVLLVGIVLAILR